MERAESVRVAIIRLGTGEEARVQVTLRDKTFLAGYVDAADENSFVIKNAEIEKQERVAYAEVERLKAENFATGVRTSVPREIPKGARAMMKLATLGIAGRRPVEQSSSNYLSKPAIAVLVVLAVGLILIGVELKKS